MIRRLGISDASLVITICGEYSGIIVSKLRNGSSYFFTNEREDAVIIYDMLTTDQSVAHLYSKKEGRGKKILPLIIESGFYMFERVGCDYIFNIVRKKDRHIKLFVPYFGSKKICSMDNGDTMYLTDYSVYEKHKLNYIPSEI